VDVGVQLPGYRPETTELVSLREIAEVAVRAEELGFASAWVMDHIWVEGRGGRRVSAHEPMMTLAYLAARTNRIQLGLLVLCNTFRHPGQLAREAAALVDAAPGRIVLGIGAGWHEPEYRAFGFPYDHRVSRLEETLLVLRPLLEGERVDLDGRHLSLSGAQVMTTEPAPPIWVAGRGPRMVGLIARHGDGCNVGWLGPDPTPFVEHLAQVRAAGPLRPGFTASVGLFALPVEEDDRPPVLDLARRFGGMFWDGTEPDAAAIIGGPERLAAALREYERAGAQHAILNLAVAPAAAVEPTYLERAAPALGML
jgi:alkanesulfonate monooxygenase SsuD/methylene tetrahydromethanopterin reductase-like flavin-dependent oxidoreductase (luciferase family)